VLAIAFGSGEAVATFITLEALGNVLLTAVCAYGVYQVNKKYDAYLDFLYMESQSDGKFTGGKTEEGVKESQSKPGTKEKKKDKDAPHPFPKGGPPRKRSGEYLPDPAAEGSPHTTFAKKEGDYEMYIKGATFDEKGRLVGVTDCTTHGRRDHPNPHFHPATSQSGIKSGAHRFPWELTN
ncbi:MAG: hypothetical protein ACSNEK_10370, partial [Parachlamydiaceae bacterium]